MLFLGQDAEDGLAREKRPKMVTMHDLAQNEKHSDAENWE